MARKAAAYNEKRAASGLVVGRKIANQQQAKKQGRYAQCTY
jgi:hypothetical protein